MEITYLTLEHVIGGEDVDRSLIQDLLELELVAYRIDEHNSIYVAEPDSERIRVMLRLAVDLEINPAGIETIIHMRQRMFELQRELRAMRQRTLSLH